MTVALVLLVAVFATIVVWLLLRKPAPADELVMAQALDRLSEGFEWRYEEPYVAFDLPDGTTVLLEHHAGRWYEQSL